MENKNELEKKVRDIQGTIQKVFSKIDISDIVQHLEDITDFKIEPISLNEEDYRPYLTVKFTTIPVSDGRRYFKIGQDNKTLEKAYTKQYTYIITRKYDPNTGKFEQTAEQNTQEIPLSSDDI